MVKVSVSARYLGVIKVVSDQKNDFLLDLRLTPLQYSLLLRVGGAQQEDATDLKGRDGVSISGCLVTV